MNGVLKVSSVPATRQDVSNLQELLDTRLQQTQARETGICPVRRELYRQCFGICNDFYTFYCDLYVSKVYREFFFYIIKSAIQKWCLYTQKNLFSQFGIDVISLKIGN